MTIEQRLAMLVVSLGLCNAALASSITILQTQNGGTIAKVVFDMSFCEGAQFNPATVVVTGKQISVFFDAVPAQCGDAPPTPGPFFLTLPALAAGNYVLDAHLTGFSPSLPDVLFNFTLPSAVSATVAPLPSVDAYGLLLLCAGFALTACRRLRRNLIRFGKLNHG